MMNELSQTDSWLRRLRAAGPEALGELFEHYRPRLARMVELQMHPQLTGRIDASDVLQEAYLDAADRVQNFLRQPTVSTYVWLRGLTKERLIRIHRKHLGAKCRAVRRERVLPEASSILLGQQFMAGLTSPTGALRRKEVRERVERALGQLRQDDREVILMRHFEDMSNQEVAQVLGLSDSAASMRYGRAVFRLKQSLSTDLTSRGRNHEANNGNQNNQAIS